MTLLQYLARIYTSFWNDKLGDISVS